MAVTFTIPPGAIVPGTTGSPGHEGSVCPAGWTEDFDRAQMSTQVLINHSTPGDVPTFDYNFPGTFANPPPVGAITLDNIQTDATVMRVSKFEIGGISHNTEVWLRYVQQGSSVTLTSVNRTTADDNNHARGYTITGPPVEQAGHFDWPVTWTSGNTAFNNGEIILDLHIRAEPSQLWQDDFGIDHYGRLTFSRTDLIRVDPMSNPIYMELADRILEVRGSNSVPRLATVTIDARTGHVFPMQNMDLMSSAAPEKPSRYYACLVVDGRLIFSRMVFANAVRHHITHDEWTLQITLDLAEWAAQL